MVAVKAHTHACGRRKLHKFSFKMVRLVEHQKTPVVVCVLLPLQDLRRYVPPLLTSWRQNKSPESIAPQWIRAACFHDSSLSDTYGHRSRFRHYVLLPPIPFGQIVHCEAKPFPLCQCCLLRVDFADTQRAADFLRNHDAPEIVNAADYSSCFHIEISLVC